MSEENKYNIDTVWRDECLYKHPKGGMQVGTFPKGIRIEDIENEIIIISLGERSQLQNKEKAMNFFNLANQLQTAKEENEKLNYIIDKQDRQLATETEINISLTQQNKQMKDALAQIAGISRYGEYDTMTAKLQWTTVKDIAQQALKEVNNEK